MSKLEVSWVNFCRSIQIFHFHHLHNYRALSKIWQLDCSQYIFHKNNRTDLLVVNVTECYLPLFIADPVEFQMSFDRKTGKPIAISIIKLEPGAVTFEIISDEKVTGTVAQEARPSKQKVHCALGTSCFCTYRSIFLCFTCALYSVRIISMPLFWYWYSITIVILFILSAHWLQYTAYLYSECWIEPRWPWKGNIWTEGWMFLSAL